MVQPLIDLFCIKFTRQVQNINIKPVVLRSSKGGARNWIESEAEKEKRRKEEEEEEEEEGLEGEGEEEERLEGAQQMGLEAAGGGGATAGDEQRRSSAAAVVLALLLFLFSSLLPLFSPSFSSNCKNEDGRRASFTSDISMDQDDDDEKETKYRLDPNDSNKPRMGSFLYIFPVQNCKNEDGRRASFTSDISMDQDDDDEKETKYRLDPK
ncbi:hypothetical protein TEA_029503 [Camellia sinensis var. sinensis]|uniref:Uncharacterized protein n=1 Tax=Camellia sinensis var. sinensis TaxID=542762 RepID=A0A4S4DTZ3_CAMSN|nr:hypothetical protein TEA_029503 [Camellia sinensis var. sinensis]